MSRTTETTKPGGKSPTGNNPHIVQGRVTAPGRSSVGSLRVQLHERSIGPDLLVAETATGDKGEYRLEVPAKAWKARNKAKPDWVVRVLSGEDLLQTSAVRYDAALEETIDIQLPAGVAGLPSEYEMLIKDVGGHFTEAHARLMASDGRQDIDYLTRKTGWDAKKVEAMAQADQASLDTDKKVPPDLFYALFRSGQPADARSLCRKGEATLRKLWQEAANNGLIAEPPEKTIKSAVKKFHAMHVDQLLNVPALEGASTMKEMLSIAKLDKKQQLQFADLCATHGADRASLWAGAREAFGEETAARLQVHGRLAALTLNNAPLMRVLDGKGDTQELALSGLHRPKSWRELLAEEIPVPATIKGETPETRRDNYARYLAGRLRQSHPTAAMAHIVRNGELPLEQAEPVADFLTEHLGRFEIGVHPVDQYVAKADVTVAPQTLTQVKRLQRTYQMAQDERAMAVLLKPEAKLDSAYHVARHTRESFVKSFGAQLGDDPAVAERIHAKATQIHGTALNVAMGYLTSRLAPPLGLAEEATDGVGAGHFLQPVAPRAATLQAAASGVIDYPTMERLFGSVDYGACDHSRSILSPAAYLVDLLDFIEITIPNVPDEDPEKSVQDKLFTRRPDIRHLKLTTENTTTALPYIDLVNEVLEYFVANDPPTSLEGYVGHDTGDLASADLLASPQFQIDAAYDKLREAYFPPPLPYHQPLETSRRYFAQAGMPLAKAMERLRPWNGLERDSHAYGWRDILAEELEISRQEYRLLTDSSLTLNQLYGFDENTPNDFVIGELLNAKLFCRRVGIGYEDLVSLLKTRFVNPSVTLLPRLSRLGVPLATLRRLVEGGFQNDDEFLDLLPKGEGAPDATRYGGNIPDWVRAQYPQIAGLITLVAIDPNVQDDMGNFRITFAGSPDPALLVNWNFEFPSLPGEFLYHPTPHDFANDFKAEPGRNPNWVWTYAYASSNLTDGYEIKSLGDCAKLHINEGYDGWFDRNYNAAGVPAVWKNYTAGPIYNVQPGQISLHPGPANEYALVRFTAPHPGQKRYVVRGEYYPGNSGEMSAVIVLDKTISAPLFSLANIDAASEQERSFDFEVELAQGQTLDFMVGSPHGYASGDTPLSLTIHSDGWEFISGSGVQGNGSAWGAPDAPSGRQTAFIQNLGSMEQAIQLDAGSYLLSFQIANRVYSVPPNSTQPIRVVIDGQPVGAPIHAPSTEFTRVQQPFSVATSGLHTLKFAGTDGTGDKSVLLDGVTISTTERSTVAFYRLHRFIRLWKKSGWSIEQTDAAICALFKSDLSALTAGDLDTVEKLDAGFKVLLPRLGVVKRTLDTLQLGVDEGLPPLLACWSDVDTYGESALYRQLFLNPTISKLDDAFADNGYGDFLDDPSQTLAMHEKALCGAIGMTHDDFLRIAARLGYPQANAPLTLANVSALHRHAWLAKRLGLSVQELLLLFKLLLPDPLISPNPFAAPDVWAGSANAADPFDLTRRDEPPIARFIAWVRKFQELSLDVREMLALVWNLDAKGQPLPGFDETRYHDLARTLRTDFLAIDEQSSASGESAAEQAATRIALVYGGDTGERFVALILENQDSTVTALFFARYPELQPVFDAYQSASGTEEEKWAALLRKLDAVVTEHRKRDLALQRLAERAGTDMDAARALLDPKLPPDALYPLAGDEPKSPAIVHAMNLDRQGLHAAFYYASTASGDVVVDEPHAAQLDYATGGHPLPSNPAAPADPVSGRWSGWIEAPSNAPLSLAVEADPQAEVRLALDGEERTLTIAGTIRVSPPLDVRAGQLVSIVLTVENVHDRMSLTWQTPDRPRETIPPRYLYGGDSDTRSFAYMALLFENALALAGAIGLSTTEIAYLSTRPEYGMTNPAGDITLGWLNFIPNHRDAKESWGDITDQLGSRLRALMEYARIKAAWSPKREDLLTVLRDPIAATEAGDSLLYRISCQTAETLSAVLGRVGRDRTELAKLGFLRYVFDAFAPLRALAIPAATTLAAVTNEPASATVTELLREMRANVDAAAWRRRIQPVNDELRALQRDALVAYILQAFRLQPERAHIDTQDKLFEYFLMDVAMEPCMQTSRIRHALSSVQLFIERCMLNLEPTLAKLFDETKREQWVWMKRYRIWEAQRKVFLYPENWLEPELRDDKSPFFKTLEEELLQSDITDTEAEHALHNYLDSLHDVSRLEPCGICSEEVSLSGGVVSETTHVIGRTFGDNHAYYHCRLEDGVWSPWRLIDVDVEGLPLKPVVWNGRLFLFWLRIVKEMKTEMPEATGLSDQTLANQKSTGVVNDAIQYGAKQKNVSVTATLCWSEYANGKWGKTRTSDPTQIKLPMGEMTSTDAANFERWTWKLRIWPSTDGNALNLEAISEIQIIGKRWSTGFHHLLYTTGQLFEDFYTETRTDKECYFARGGSRLNTDSFFTMYYKNFNNDEVSHKHNLIKRMHPFSISRDYFQPTPQHPYYYCADSAKWDAPFIYKDGVDIFFVQLSPT